MDNIAKRILEEREKRAQLQEQYLDKYKNTLIVLRVNYPGVNKDSELSRSIFQYIYKEVIDMFRINIEAEISNITVEGCFGLVVVNEDCNVVKENTIIIEEFHKLGRFVDIDVFNSKTKLSLSRREFGYKSRKCYLCDNDAHICVRNKSHGVEALIRYMKDIYDDYIKDVHVYENK